ncbi:ATP-binding protein [Nocardiopsis changdeensis]|uniref:ATP-binding protein n=1 Tax=Nocardiopsis changdeensis TaxID=2831969 RepID=UPI003F466268
MIPQLRRWVHASSGLDRAAAAPLIEAAVLLFDNALAHTRSGQPGGSTRLVLTRRPHCLHLAVKDQGPLPGHGPGEPVLGRGAGLARLAQLCARWGWYGDQRGHTVWTEVPRPQALP